MHQYVEVQAVFNIFLLLDIIKGFNLDISEVQCKDPDAIEGVLFKVSTHSVGGVAVYSCPRGHIMQGNSTRVCMKSGLWRGQAPSCTCKIIFVTIDFD